MTIDKVKILLAEHNEFIRDALQKALEIEGYYVLAVKTAMQGLKAVKKEHFDVGIADYELPDANGVELFLLMNRFCPNMVRILMTTYGELKTLSDIYKYGIDDAIEKPFAFEKLIVIIEANIRKRKQESRRKVGR